MAAAKSTRTQRAASISRHKPPPGRRTRPTLPDLAPIFHALVDATSLVRTAHMALQCGDFGPEEFTFRAGIEALQKVRNDLDRAEGAISRFRRTQQAKGRRGRS